MDHNEADVLAYMSFPSQHRVRLHSTNPLERLNKDVTRRTDVVSIFPNEESMTASTILPTSALSGRWPSNASACGRITERASGGLR